MRHHTSSDSLRALAARVLGLVVLCFFALATSGFGPPVLIESESAAAPIDPGTLRLMGGDEKPELLSEAVAILDASSGQVVYEVNARERRAPASTTKMMTALVTIENADLAEVVTASDGVLVEPSIIGLEPGDRLTVEQLLYGLLLPSGNDAALALAEHVGGTVGEFAEMMNDKADRLGMTGTHFVNPHGLDEEGHYSTARDLAMLARAAMQNPVFERIVGTREYRIDDGPVRWYFESTNQLLGNYPGADGVKTGYTDEAGRCLVFSATRDGRRAISVTLGSSDVWEQSGSLLDYFFDNYVSVPLSLPMLNLSSYGGLMASETVTVEEGLDLPLPAWQVRHLRWSVLASDGIYSGTGSLGKVTYTVLGDEVAEVAMLAREGG